MLATTDMRLLVHPHNLNKGLKFEQEEHSDKRTRRWHPNAARNMEEKALKLKDRACWHFVAL
jgi:hypothetical protein